MSQHFYVTFCLFVSTECFNCYDKQYKPALNQTTMRKSNMQKYPTHGLAFHAKKLKIWIFLRYLIPDR